MSDQPSFETQMHPERQAGGFTHNNGSLAFYLRIDALLNPDMVVLDFGAGRGVQLDGNDYTNRFVALKGKVKKLVGVDIDTAVLENKGLDEVHVIEPNKPLPFADATFDLIFADWVIEHIEDPASFVAEINRVLKPGGWFCARTPNKWGYFAVISRLVAGGLEAKLLRFAQPGRQERDVFPKFYRMNTMAAIRAGFPKERWTNASYMHNPDPSYHGNRSWLYQMIELYQGLPIRGLSTVLLLFLQKK